MRFKDQRVWIRADAAGRPILDGAGRAEMKYRETDSKSYRPAAANLLPDPDPEVRGDGEGDGGGEARAPSARPRPRRLC